MKRSFLKNLLPWLIVALACAWILAALRPARNGSSFDLNAFGQLPVLNGGRIKPLDTVARSSLLIMNGKQRLRVPDGRPMAATEWLLNVLYDPKRVNGIPLFRIDNPDVLGLMGMMQSKNRYFSFDEIAPHIGQIDTQMRHISQIKAELRSPFQRALVSLADSLFLYQRLQNTLQTGGAADVELYFVEARKRISAALEKHEIDPSPLEKSFEGIRNDVRNLTMMSDLAEFYVVSDPKNPSDINRWASVGKWLLFGERDLLLHSSVRAYAAMGDAFRSADRVKFDETVRSYNQWLDEYAASAKRRARYEHIFNRLAPFYRSMMLYVAALLIIFLSLVIWRDPLYRSACFLLIFAFAVHTLGLISRMVIQGRPPVTNLYSSAVFVGWVSVLLGIILERISKRGLGTTVASAIGFVTLIIAHHLAVQGDTLEMMRAVLDSNFWLATHVVFITIGYSSTFLSGALGILFIGRRLFDRKFSADASDHLQRLIYGVVCFSTFFSFVGTVLGGIWADQSWGRFWGWDPKENGALLIVLWNAAILHARWGRLVGDRGIAVMAVVGNVVTSLSWFGVNMLGIGLHSYGFMDKAFAWLLFFIITQLLIIGGAFVPSPAHLETLSSERKRPKNRN